MMLFTWKSTFSRWFEKFFTKYNILYSIQCLWSIFIILLWEAPGKARVFKIKVLVKFWLKMMHLSQRTSAFHIFNGFGHFSSYVTSLNIEPLFTSDMTFVGSNWLINFTRNIWFHRQFSIGFEPLPSYKHRN